MWARGPSPDRLSPARSAPAVLAKAGSRALQRPLQEQPKPVYSTHAEMERKRKIIHGLLPWGGALLPQLPSKGLMASKNTRALARTVLTATVGKAVHRRAAVSRW